MTKLLCRRWIEVLSGALILCACGGGGSSGGGGGTSSPPPASVTVSTEPAFAGLSFSSPVAMLQAPGDSTRWFVAEQAGRVRVFDNDAMVTAFSTFIDISTRVTFSGETGLLGMAFHPNFPTDPRAYLFYSHTDGSAGLVSQLSEFTTSDGGQTLDPASERILLTIDKPEDNHNGGGIAFGPADGFLYLGIGDGGGGNDQHGAFGNAQLLTNLLGKMLRIDIAAGAGSFNYRIPSDNPFAANPPCGVNGSGTMNCPEIFAWGFRNPWRWSFDRQTGELWVGDVGQNAREEVDRVVLGGNYGWRCFEGTRNTGLACGSPLNLQAPIVDYGRTVGTTVTGGYVYRGSLYPALAGRYIFGDFGSGRIWNIPNTTAPTLEVTTGLDTGLNMSTFGEANDGEIYVVSYDGRLFHITD
jgi:glucose/arabinose dehydrogenase